MRTLTFRIALAVLAGAAVGACGLANRREVYRGNDGEALKAIVSAIDRGKAICSRTLAGTPPSACSRSIGSGAATRRAG